MRRGANIEFRAFKRKDGRTQLYRVKRGRSKSEYFHGALQTPVNQEVSMFVLKSDPSVKVKLLEQRADSSVSVEGPGGDVMDGPAHEFFAKYREATAEEMEPVPVSKDDKKDGPKTVA